MRDGLINANPLVGVPLAKKERAAKTYLTHEQLQAFAVNENPIKGSWLVPFLH